MSRRIVMLNKTSQRELRPPNASIAFPMSLAPGKNGAITDVTDVKRYPWPNSFANKTAILKIHVAAGTMCRGKAVATLKFAYSIANILSAEKPCSAEI